MDRISLDEVLNRIDGTVQQKRPATLPLLEALGCVLGEDIIAQNDQPPFPRSPMDGYAVRAEDTLGAEHIAPKVLKVIGRSYAGQPALSRVGQGEAVRIMTGGAIPPGADCVVKQEDTDYGLQDVRVFLQAGKNSNICFTGEDFQKGTILVRKGERITAAAIAVAAAAGHCKIQATPKIKVSLLATGDEICASGQTVSYGQIYDSNTPYLAGRLLELNVSPADQTRCNDQLDNTAEALKALLLEADAVITTGGVSVGERDMIPAAILRIGGRIIFHGVAMKPGMPTLLAMVQGKPVLGLSGNPYSAAVAFELIGRPILAKLSGDQALTAKQSEGMLTDGYQKSGRVTRYLCGILQDGRITLPKAQGNAQIHSFVKCNCLVEVMPERLPLESGTKVRIYKIY